MFYFVPAWYPAGRIWEDMTGAWYSSRPIFDDTISQLRMFEQAGEPSRLLILNYMPNLRYFTHQYDLFEVERWSVFDAIQNIEGDEQVHFDYKSLAWPEGCEFLNSPFLALVRQQGQEIGRVEFGPDGQVIHIDYRENGVQTLRYVFDDRGFVSSCVVYKEGWPIYRDYLNRHGQWQIREHLTDGDHRVEVHPSQQERFLKAIYPTLEDLIREVLRLYLQGKAGADDVIILASHDGHNQLVQSVKGRQKLVLSYYQERFDVMNQDRLRTDLERSDLVIADSLALTAQLEFQTARPIQHLSPFDTRLTLGKSQRLKEQIVHFILDGLSHQEAEEQLLRVVEVMERTPDVHLSLVTYSGDFGQRQEWEEWVQGFLKRQPQDFLFLEEKSQPSYEVTENKRPVSRVTYHALNSEMDTLQALEQARLIIDLSEQPHLYTQIGGISSGVPQINQYPTEFVQHLKNGYILTQGTNLSDALDYYLGGLRNWNQALVYAVQKITDYTSGKLVQKLIDSIE